VTAGYSGTPLVAKLGVKAGAQVAVVGAPAGFEAALAPLPAGASVRRRLGKGVEMVVAFVKARAALERHWDAWTASLPPAGMLWVAWPKKASGVRTDVDENVVREVALAHGWVDTKVCAIDETWSGLRVVLRRANRPSQ
jgi:hypothetical protein